MRNLKLYLLLPLLLLNASSASASFFSYTVGQSTGRSNAEYEDNQKAKDEGRISCVPQQPQDPSYNLWTCSDAYGNKYPDMVITLKSEIERLKGTKKVAAGLGWPKPDPKPAPVPPKKP
jgi:hypothetical protein